MTFLNILKDYITDLEKAFEASEASRAFTPELSYRPMLDTFFRNILSEYDRDVECVSEPKNQSHYGRPDWRFHDKKSLGIYGYVEAKSLDIGKQLNIDDHIEQINRYKELNYNLILTDGIDFIFLYPDGTMKNISISNKSRSPWQLNVEAALLENEFRNFFEECKSRVVNEDLLIEDIAKRAIPLSMNINEICQINEKVANEKELELILKLKGIKVTLSSYIDETLHNNEKFSDFITQVLLFGLIYSHRVTYNKQDTPIVRYQKINTYLLGMLDDEDVLLPFKGIVGVLSKELEDDIGLIGSWYQDSLLYLSYISLTVEQLSEPDYHSLFEKFLSIYKPLVRFDYGAFYTPKPLAKFLVRICNEIVEKSKKITLINNFCTVVDPCCGTGTFIEELLKNDGLINKSAQNIVGYEILPAPYALANYRMSMIEEDASKVKLILADTLSDHLLSKPEFNKSDTYSKFLERELNDAYNYSNSDIEIILCNPPVSDSYDFRNANHNFINDLIEDFRPPSEKRASRSNIQKQVRNSFMYFLRWSIEKLESKDVAILGVVVPSTFIESPSYSYARKYLAEKFDNLWFVKFDGDLRAKNEAPNLFMTQQGRAVIIAEKGLANKEKKIKYIDISNYGIDEKNEFLNESRLQCFEERALTFTYGVEDFALDLKSLVSGFDFSSNIGKEYYEKFWNIFDKTNTVKSVFQRSCSGVKLGATGMYVNADDRILRRRFYDLTRGDDLAKQYDLKFSKQSSPKRPALSKVKTVVDSLKSIGFDSDDIDSYPIIKYSFRPFIETSAFIHEEMLKLMQNKDGKGTRLRPEVMCLYSGLSDHITFVSAKNLKEQDSKLGRFVSFAWELPDNDLTRRGNAMVLSNVFQEYSITDKKNQLCNNVNNRLVDHFYSQKKAMKRSEISKMLTYYSYAILCSNKYLERYHGPLYYMNEGIEDICIPIFNSFEIVEYIADLGRKIAELEKSGMRKCDAVLNESFESFELEKIEYDEKTQMAYLMSKQKEIELYIPKEVYNFTISGYNILSKWSDLRKFKNLRRKFKIEDFSELNEIIERIALQIQFINELDDYFDKCIHTEKLILPN